MKKACILLAFTLLPALYLDGCGSSDTHPTDKLVEYIPLSPVYPVCGGQSASEAYQLLATEVNAGRSRRTAVLLGL